MPLSDLFHALPFVLLLGVVPGIALTTLIAPRLSWAERLAAALDSCRRYLPAGTRWTQPQGGMNLWVRLPEPLDAGELLPRAQKEGVAYLPGRYFAVSRLEAGALRLSFAGLEPEQIRHGLAVLGKIVAEELATAAQRVEPSSALV